jgi:hypothetical protein
VVTSVSGVNYLSESLSLVDVTSSSSTKSEISTYGNPFPDKTIKAIRLRFIWGNTVNEKVIDLEGNQVLHSEYEVTDDSYEFSVTRTFSEENKPIFIDNIIEHGIYDFYYSYNIGQYSQSSF